MPKMTAEERSAKWLADIEEVERMTPDQLRLELRRQSFGAPSVIQAAAVVALARDISQLGQRNSDRRFNGKPRRWCGHHCPFPEGCVTCDL